MNDKTPFTSKLIIILLVLVLTALGVIIFQNYQRPVPSETASIHPEGSYSEIPPLRLREPHVPPTVPMTNRTRLVPATAPAPAASSARQTYPAPALSANAIDSRPQAGYAPQPFLQPVPVADGFVASGSGTEVSGRVFLSGTPPPEKVIDFSGPNEATCGRMHPAPIMTRHYLVGPEGELANVFVYIKEGAPKSSARGESPLLDQVGCLYEPYVLGVTAGQDMIIRNSDPFMHNVHAMPRVSGNQSFNIAQFVKGQTNKKRFDHQEVLLRIQCDVHPWMFAFIGVSDNPFFAVTDKEGRFTIKGLPPGTYMVEAVHPKAGKKSQQISVGDGERKNLDINLSVPGSAALKVASGN